MIDIDVMSYGGGRQTAGMLAMMMLGELPTPDFVVFADTEGELPETYEYNDQYARPWCDDLGVEFITVQQSGSHYGTSLYDYFWKYETVPMPFHRMCSEKFKLIPIQRFYKQFRPCLINAIIGISADESQRVKDSGLKGVTNQYPLVTRNLTRRDCEAAIIKIGAPLPPKSACYYCPFQHLVRWKRTKTNHPDLIQKVIALESRASARKAGQAILGHNKPIARVLEGDQLEMELGLEEMLDAEATCMSGVCFV